MVARSGWTASAGPDAPQAYRPAAAGSRAGKSSSSTERSVERQTAWRPTALPLVAPLRRAAKHALRRRTYAAASVGVSRSPVSRLVSRGVRRWADRVLIADAVRPACGHVLVLTLLTRLRRRADR